MKRIRTVPAQGLAAFVLAMLVAAAASAGVAAPTPAAARATVKVAFNPELRRPILVDGRGMTLYGWTSDTKGHPSCYDDAVYHCSRAWPPLLSTGSPRAGTGVDASILRVVVRNGGKLQVAYRGHPLYGNAGARRFGLAADRKPGDVNGLGFVGLWFVLSPKGAMITH